MSIVVAVMMVTCLRMGVIGDKSQCELISIPMCKDIGYNYTRLPNQFNHETQEEAGLEVHQFFPLVKIECSPDLRFFLCSLYTPICMDTYKHRLPACRSVCQRARKGCLPVMQKYGFEWPKRMSCEDLPEFGGAELCMDAQAQDPSNRERSRSSVTKRPGVGSIATQSSESSQCQCEVCGASSVHPSYGNRLIRLRPGDLGFNNSIEGWAGQDNCAAPCVSPFFTREDRDFTELWLSVWSLICFISTSLTFTTFLMDTSRFHYPERPIMFLSLCYFMVSVGYLVRVLIGHEAVSCGLQRPGDQGPNVANMMVTRSGLPAADSSEESLVCITVFVLVYYFSMASSVWWVILTFTWYLSAGLKWAQESISQYSQWYHCLAWSLPMVQTVTVLLTSSVEGDPVSGICYVGIRNVSNLIIFLLVPLIIYLVLGVSFLSAGFISLFRIRTLIKEQGGKGKIDKLEKLMVKIGIFSVLYIVPAGTVIACGCYELVGRPHWERSYLCPDCVPRDQLSFPDFRVLMLKYFMCLAVGITSGFWVWSGKTLDSWGSCISRLCQFSTFRKTVRPDGRRGDPLPDLPPGGGNSVIRSTTPATQTGNIYSTISHNQQGHQL